MATDPPPGSRTSRSGRCRPLSPSQVVCSVKSQCSTMPAISTTRRSCSSPQRPRTDGARRAVTNVAVSVRNRSWPSASERTCSTNPAYAERRETSRAPSWFSTLPSESRSGATSDSTACRRASRSPRASAVWRPSAVVASSRNEEPARSSACAESAANESDSRLSARSTSTTFSAVIRRSAASSVSARSARRSSNCARPRANTAATIAATAAAARASSRAVVMTASSPKGPTKTRRRAQRRS